MKKIKGTDLPPGPIRTLFEELKRLHREAGEPSVRQLAANTAISHATVHSALRGPRVPRWPNLELILEQLQVDPGQIKPLWIDARNAEDEDEDEESTTGTLTWRRPTLPRTRLKTTPGDSTALLIIGDIDPHEVSITSKDRLVLAALFSEYFSTNLDHPPTSNTYESVARRLGWTRTTVVKRVEYLRHRLATAGVPGMSGYHAMHNLADFALRVSLLTDKDIEALPSGVEPAPAPNHPPNHQ